MADTPLVGFRLCRLVIGRKCQVAVEGTAFSAEFEIPVCAGDSGLFLVTLFYDRPFKVCCDVEGVVAERNRCVCPHDAQVVLEMVT